MNKERRKAIAEAVALLEQAKGILETARDEEQEALDAMPDALRESERGQAMEAAYDNLDCACAELDSVLQQAEDAAA